MSQPKYRVGQPVTVRPTTREAFDGFILSVSAGTKYAVNPQSRTLNPSLWAYLVSDNPHQPARGGSGRWVEYVVFPRNPDCKGNGMSWEDIKKSLGCKSKQPAKV